MVDGVVCQGDLNESVMVRSAVTDDEPERLEQEAESLGGGIEEIGAEHWQLIEQVYRDGLRGVVSCFEIGERIELGLSFGFEFADATLDPGEDCATGVVLGFDGADKTVLTVTEIADGSAKSIKLGGAIRVCSVVDDAKVDGEKGASIRTEDPLGEELGDSSEKWVFSDPNAGGVIWGAFGDLAGVVEGWLTDVVRMVLVEAAVHSSTAGLADHERAQKIGASGLGV